MTGTERLRPSPTRWPLLMVTRGIAITSFAVCLAVLIGHTRNGWPFWSTDAIGRQHLKGVGVAVLGTLVSEQPPEAGLVVFGYAGALVPVAIGIAILRYHLYDIDRLISRSVGYTVVTGVLAVVFAATAIALSALLGSLAQGESLAVAASTLIVLGLFGPLRRRAQAAVGKRFDRSLYDASVTVQAMSVRLPDDVDLERVKADVLGVVDRTFHPTQAGLWLREAPR